MWVNILVLGGYAGRCLLVTFGSYPDAVVLASLPALVV